MKKKIFLTILITGMAISMIACGRGESSEDEHMEEKVKQHEEKIIEIDEKTLFEEYLEEVLEPQYGLFQRHQIGIMHAVEEQWFDPAGIMNATILDFDSDNNDEMLVFYTDSATSGANYTVYMDMYEIEDDEVVLGDSTMLPSRQGVNYNECYGGVTLSPAQWMKLFLNVTVVKTDDEYVIVCEERNVASCFADGSFENYWIISYEDKEIEYEATFSQLGAGSSDFQYFVYEFEEGRLEESELYYSEWEEEPGKYSDFGTAITEFFEEYDIEVSYGYNDFFDSILGHANEMIPVFKFTNEVVSADYSAGVYEFQAELIVEF